ncbi:MAG: DUF1844 domain-containing protein [Candidatus Omnitrophica bacterium]|nr:DUF1844 domain-containing protein [Candidatus Omnitrophota bacterium]
MDNVRFTEKRVDEGWKERAAHEKEGGAGSSGKQASSENASKSDDFSYFLTSLATQAMVHFGEIENPITKTKSIDLNAGQQIIDLLILLKQKTTGNLTVDESKLLMALLADLQMRFVSLKAINK